MLGYIEMYALMAFQMVFVYKLLAEVVNQVQSMVSGPTESQKDRSLDKQRLQSWMLSWMTNLVDDEEMGCMPTIEY